MKLKNYMTTSIKIKMKLSINKMIILKIYLTKF